MTCRSPRKTATRWFTTEDFSIRLCVRMDGGVRPEPAVRARALPCPVDAEQGADLELDPEQAGVDTG